MSVRIEHGDMLQVLGAMCAAGERVHAIVTDPPYHLTSIVKRFGADDAAPAKAGKTGAYARASAGFMGKKWDGGDIAFRPGTWRLCWELLPPGGYLLAFSGTRTYHRMAMAIEEAGFEIRDMVAWLYGSGFPKSLNVSKALDRAAGAEREVVGPPTRHGGGSSGIYAQDHWTLANQATMGAQTAPATDAARQWEGWGTALKPALEPICLARKPLVGTVAGNVLAHGTGALNIDGCRVGDEQTITLRHGHSGDNGIYGGDSRSFSRLNPPGRWPANVCHDGSDEVLRAAFPASSGQHSDALRDSDTGKTQHVYGTMTRGNGRAGEASADRRYSDRGTTDFAALPGSRRGDNGSAARFFYNSKADADDRLGSKHPTVKPVDLMRWLVRLITPPGGTVLDPFAGSGTTGMACLAEGIDCILVEREDEYVADIRRRIAHVSGEDTPLFGGS